MQSIREAHPRSVYHSRKAAAAHGDFFDGDVFQCAKRCENSADLGSGKLVEASCQHPLEFERHSDGDRDATRHDLGGGDALAL